MRLPRILCLSSLLVTLGVSLPALAEGDHEHHEEPTAEAKAAPHAHDEAAPHGHDEAAAHGHDEAAAHGEHGGDHAPTFDDVNWFYGFLGEKEGVTPDLLWRPTGMPVPFGALALNAAILYGLLFKFGRKPIGDALRKRKHDIVKSMEEAAQVEAEAAARLAEYQRKLDEIDADIARILSEMKESAEAESARILSEAKERRARMERDAHLLIEQELKVARETLVRETVRAAVKSAESSLTAKVGDADQQRLGDEFLASIKASGSALRGRL